jgi:hypothetical protein
LNVWAQNSILHWTLKVTKLVFGTQQLKSNMTIQLANFSKNLKTETQTNRFEHNSTTCKVSAFCSSIQMRF